MDEPRAERGNWSNRLEYICSVIGCMVSLTNVWRFPYICFRNGGAAFLIPYLLTMAVVGIPLFLLESAICQFSNLGPGKVWIICPLFRGIGYGMMVLAAMHSLYYNVIISWALFYLAMSFNSELPWTTCGNWWNSNSCIPVGASEVMYVAALIPYVMLLALLIRGSLLPGAVDGVYYYVVPEWHRLLDWQVWQTASSQMFYSLWLASGGVGTLASFNRFHNNIYRDSFLLPVLDVLTSVFAGFVVCVYMGYLAHVQHRTVYEVVQHGMGLAFIAYPEALATMPLPQLWAVLFFLVLVTVGLSSQFVLVQTISTAVVDTFPQKFGHRKRWITLTVCILGFLLGIPFVTQGGQYVLLMCDWYLVIPAVLLPAMAVKVLAWIYGTGRLFDDITMMTGHRPDLVWHVMWRVITPGFLSAIWIWVLKEWIPVPGFPAWTKDLGYVIAFLPLIPVPVMAVRQLFLVPGGGTLIQRLAASLRPSPRWKPAPSRIQDTESGVPLQTMALTPEHDQNVCP